MTRSPELLCAYLQTTYRVLANSGPIDLRVGTGSAQLDSLLLASQSRTWAIVTASNPRSQQLPEQENAARNEQMMLAIRAGGWRCIDALGVPDDADWVAEQSFLVIGINRDDARELARRWNQNAFVCGRRGEPPQLAWVE